MAWSGWTKAVLINQFDQESALRIKLAFAARASLACPVRRIASPQRAPVEGESFKRNAAARPLNPSSTNF
ncbi:hypothetical protein AB9K34_01615 [Sedimentitalea sp. XS_ASV28]|uniref:hypothetical protein n=1 Tax=Sedimentitalea sp. XS_ASV28 TaxID=3241296 RepID=UPI00351265FE